MWIEMKSTYAGGVGMFIAGQRLDLPPDILEHIPTDSYHECKAPWDEHIDPLAVQARVVEKATEHASRLAELYEQARAKADAMVGSVSQAQAELDNADKAAREASKAADKAKGEGKKRLQAEAYGSARVHERASAVYQIAHAQLRIALADADLKRLDADDAALNVAAAQHKLRDMQPKPEPESKPDDDKTNEATLSNDGQGQALPPIGDVTEPRTADADGTEKEPVDPEKKTNDPERSGNEMKPESKPKSKTKEQGTPKDKQARPAKTK